MKQEKTLTTKITAFPIFNKIKEEDLSKLLGCVGYRIEQYKKGELIFVEGDYLENIGVIISGSVDMIKEDAWGTKTIVIRMSSPTLFGETFICGNDSITSVSFEAVEDTTVMFIPVHRAMHSCTNACAVHQQLIENIIKLIADKNLMLMRKMEVISKRTLREKIMAYLAQQAQQQGTKYFEIPLRRVELAEYLCADRSALTRELTNMKNAHIIDYDRNVFRLMQI